MSDKILYNDDSWLDILNILAFTNDFTASLGVKGVALSPYTLEGIAAGMKMDFPHFEGEHKASPFKKAANFLCYFNAQRPIAKPFPASLVGENIHKITNHQNAIVSYFYVCAALHGASLYKSNGDGLCVIENPIKVSKHSLEDIVDALASAAPQSHFKIVSVLLEQLVYKTNPECQY